MPFKNLAKQNQGFTLIEVVFVLALFLMVIGVTISIFLSILDQQHRILTEQELLNQGSYVFEYMSKGLRMAVKDQDGSCLGDTGNTYVLTHCPNGDTEPCEGVKFINQSDGNSCQEFFLDTESDPQQPMLMEVKDGGQAQPLLSGGFDITKAKFVLDGDQALQQTASGDGFQPRLTMLLDLKTKGDSPVEKTVQTTVSIRNLNIP
jgi:type II secretory pathway component PulJ